MKRRTRYRVYFDEHGKHWCVCTLWPGDKPGRRRTPFIRATQLGRALDMLQARIDRYANGEKP